MNEKELIAKTEEIEKIYAMVSKLRENGEFGLADHYEYQIKLKENHVNYLKSLEYQKDSVKNEK